MARIRYISAGKQLQLRNGSDFVACRQEEYSVQFRNRGQIVVFDPLRTLRESLPGRQVDYRRTIRYNTG